MPSRFTGDISKRDLTVTTTTFVLTGTITLGTPGPQMEHALLNVLDDERRPQARLFELVRDDLKRRIESLSVVLILQPLLVCHGGHTNSPASLRHRSIRGVGH